MSSNKGWEFSAYVQLEYLEGCTLEEMLDECLEEEDLESFRKLFYEYMNKISYRPQQPVSDYDLIFGNILVDMNGRWNLIDYEWTFEEIVDTNALAFRALYCYQMGNGKRKKLVLEDWTKELGINEEAAKEYRARERRFQKAVTGNRVSVSDMRVLLGRRAIPWQGFLRTWKTTRYRFSKIMARATVLSIPIISISAIW